MFMVVEDVLLKRFSKKKGRPYYVVPTEKLFILLETLQSSTSWQFCLTRLKISVSTFKMLLWFVMKTIADNSHDNAVVALERKDG